MVVVCLILLSLVSSYSPQVSGYLNLLANTIDNFTHGLAVAASFLVSKKVRGGAGGAPQSQGDEACVAPHTCSAPCFLHLHTPHGSPTSWLLFWTRPPSVLNHWLLLLQTRLLGVPCFCQAAGGARSASRSYSCHLLALPQAPACS